MVHTNITGRGWVLAAVLTAAGLTPVAQAAPAGGVRILTPAGIENFTELQPAIDAAVDGDVLLIGPGSYGPAVVDGKGLALVGFPGGGVTLAGGLTVRNQTFHNLVVVGVDLRTPNLAPALRVENSSGHVRLQACDLQGGQVWKDGGDAVELRSTSSVVFVDCAIRGADGLDDFGPLQSGGHGGMGVDAQSALVAFHRCTVTGGDGGGGDEGGGHAGYGLRAYQSWTSATSARFEGGDGGLAIFGIDGLARAGIALETGDAMAELLETQAVGGLHPDGTPESGISGRPGNTVTYPGQGRHVTAAWVQSDGAALVLSLEGGSGDSFLLLQSRSFAFEPVPGFSGLWFVPRPFLAPASPTVTLPPSGKLNLPLRVHDVPADRARQRLFLQGLFLSSTGQRFLSGPVHVYVLNRDVGPDCDSNGLSDYVDVLEGLAPDLNGNLIPDPCPGG